MAVVLITGGTGLIGRRVVDLWDLEQEPVLIGRPAHDLLEPTRLASEIERVGPDVVLHLAWCSSSVPDYRNSPLNDRWAEVTLEASRGCDRVGSRFVVAGSVLDDRPPTDPYTRAKHRLRNALEESASQVLLTWLRPFYVFDPTGRRPGVLAAARDASERGTSVGLRAPDARHDFVHVDDVARAIHTLIAADLRGSVDIGSGSTHSVAELVEAVGLRWHDVDEHDDVEHDERVARTSSLHAAGWTPRETERFFGDD